MYKGVVRVTPLQDYHLELTFDGGEVRVFDVTPYLEAGVFRDLKDPSLFRDVRVVFDTIEWRNGADLDPEVLYEESVPRSTASVVAENEMKFNDKPDS